MLNNRSYKTVISGQRESSVVNSTVTWNLALGNYFEKKIPNMVVGPPCSSRNLQDKVPKEKKMCRTEALGTT